MKKLVVTPLSNTIWWASVNEKKGLIVGNDRKDVTDNAIEAVFQHLIGMDGFKTEGFAGYDIPNIDGDACVTMCVIDRSKYKIMTADEYDSLKDEMDNMRRYMDDSGKENK